MQDNPRVARIEQDNFPIVRTEKDGNNKLAMQTRCTSCLVEQYAPAVYELSTIGWTCPWCGEEIKPMEEEIYLQIIRDELCRV